MAFLKEVWQELRYRVTWPTWEELQRVTFAVVITFILLTALIALMDLFSRKIMEFLYQMF